MAGLSVRWAVRTATWQPTSQEWQFLLSLLPQEEQQAVSQFVQVADQQRALVSRLLQRHCVATALGMPHNQVVIKRTKGRKPYAGNPLPTEAAPNFNFNVSHEGEYVVIAAEPVCICGVDIAAPREGRVGRHQTLQQFFAAFQRQLTTNEWRTVHALAVDEAAQEDVFRQLWSLKEAFVKARGDGLGFDLGRAEFEVQRTAGQTVAAATLLVDGVLMPSWRFHLQRLGQQHWVAVARGPPCDIVDAWGEFRASLRMPHPSPEVLQAALLAPSPPFSLLSVADLVPASRLADYAAAGGDCT